MPRALVILLLLPIGTSAAEGIGPPPKKPRDVPNLERAEATRILRTSGDPDALTPAALSLCRTDDAESLDALAVFLLDTAFHKRIDDELNYKSGFLNLNEIVTAVGALGTERAEALLLRLVRDKTYTAHWYRTRGMIRGVSKLRRPSAETFAFLEAQLDNRRGQPGAVVDALMALGSEPALKLLEKALLSQTYSAGTRTGWMSDMVPLRIKPEFVAMFKRLLASDLRREPKEIDRLVAVIFDYRPDAWWPFGNRPPRPPAWKDAPGDTLKELLVIADMSLKLEVSKETRAAVVRSAKEILTIVTERDRK